VLSVTVEEPPDPASPSTPAVLPDTKLAGPPAAGTPSSAVATALGLLAITAAGARVFASRVSRVEVSQGPARGRG
jgi:hypothetical protein